MTLAIPLRTLCISNAIGIPWRIVLSIALRCVKHWTEHVGDPELMLGIVHSTELYVYNRDARFMLDKSSLTSLHMYY